MDVLEFCRAMPKVELHVHLEGSIRPETVLSLAKKNNIALPADTVEGLREWYVFRDFPHFVEIYVSVSNCIKSPEDIEFIAREFLVGQKDQNILHSEVTYTASTIEKLAGIPFDEQMDALNRAMDWGKKELGISMGLIIDIVRGVSGDSALGLAENVVRHKDRGICALGIAGEEILGEVPHYADAFRAVQNAGIPIIPHAGEIAGPEIIWEALEFTQCKRIGHGLRCLEDDSLVEHLVENQIVLEVCPSSNVCLAGVKSIADHPVRQMRERGIKVTINSDDPPMFNTTLSEEYARCAVAFGWNEADLEALTETAQNSSLACHA